MKIAFFGTPAIALPILNALVDQHEIVAIVTSPDAPTGRKQIPTPSPVADWATQHHIPVLKPKQVKHNPELLDQLQSLNADIFIVVAYGKILPVELIRIPRLLTLNVHFSLLPKYRGASPIQTALLNGENVTGTSIFVLEQGLDTGPLLAQQSLTIGQQDDYITLAGKLAELSAELLLQLLPDYDSGKLSPQPQDHSQATVTKIFRKADGAIDWSKSAGQIHNQFRAFRLWPGIWTTWQGQMLKILDCEPGPSHSSSQSPPGTVLQNRIVCGGDTTLVIHELQPAGGKPQAFSSFLNGHPKILGDVLSSF